MERESPRNCDSPKGGRERSEALETLPGEEWTQRAWIPKKSYTGREPSGTPLGKAFLQLLHKP